MKTLELTLMTLATFGIYGCYVYYLITKEDEPAPTNLLFGIGSGLDAFLFNSGVKPKKAIQSAPNVIEQRLNE
jgi:hypothetical protein